MVVLGLFMLVALSASVEDGNLDGGWLVPYTSTEFDRQEIFRFISENSPKIAPIDLPDKGWAYLATKNIEEGENVSIMDPSLIMTSFDDFPLEKYVKDAPMQIRLIVRLLYEKFIADYNFISRYVALFPHEVHCVHNWTSVEKIEYDEVRVFDIGVEDDINIFGSFNTFVGKI
jgi:hypothetical protein